MKDFFDIITDKLSNNDTEILSHITKFMQGFCQEHNSIDIILRDQSINLTKYKLWRIEDENKRKVKNDSTLKWK